MFLFKKFDQFKYLEMIPWKIKGRLHVVLKHSRCSDMEGKRKGKEELGCGPKENFKEKEKGTWD